MNFLALFKSWLCRRLQAYLYMMQSTAQSETKQVLCPGICMDFRQRIVLWPIQ